MKKNPHVLFIAIPFIPERYFGVQEYAKFRGWQLIVENGVGRLPASLRADGVIATLDGGRVLSDFAKMIRRRGIPLVDLCGNCTVKGIARATVDDSAIGELAARHFADRQFRHLAYFSRDWTCANTMQFEAFRAGTPKGEVSAWVWNKEARKNSDDWYDFSAWLEKLVADAHKPFGVFCHDDFAAMRVNDACIIRNVTIPDEVAVLGVGNTISICERECISLSSIRIDYRRIGCEAAKLLDSMMNGKKVAEEVLIPPSGIAERQSTDALGADDPTVKKALDHIHQHLSEPMGAAQVAAAIGIPRQKLDRLFAKELARAVGKEILRQRISAVKTLLAGSDGDLAEIAGKTGFCNPSYLILVFHRETGMTPRDWRTRHAEVT